MVKNRRGSALEAREHNFAVPRNIYNLYIDIPEEKIKSEFPKENPR